MSSCRFIATMVLQNSTMPDTLAAVFLVDLEGHTFVERESQICPKVKLAVLTIHSTQLQARLGSQHFQAGEREAVTHSLSF